ncbi:MAG: hypothetical protein WCP45_18310 [Verrucomicrobiota bacterium]
MQPDTTATQPQPQATTDPARPSGNTPLVDALSVLSSALTRLAIAQGARITELEVQVRAVAEKVHAATTAADNRALVDAIERLSEHVGGGIDHGFRSVCVRMDH